MFPFPLTVLLWTLSHPLPLPFLAPDKVPFPEWQGLMLSPPCCTLACLHPCIRLCHPALTCTNTISPRGRRRSR